jgi:ABC-type dipeptide/oligopeptide/nickel transport system ATPase subunit
VLIETENLHFSHKINRPWIIDNVSLSVRENESIGIVGESGSGKSTLIRILNGMLPVSQGTVRIGGKDIEERIKEGKRSVQRFGQMVFQSPRGSFDPRMRLARSISEPVRALERRLPSENEVAEVMERVGLSEGLLDRYPHQLSGGQLQRVSLARALLVSPTVLYADEPTSALDVSVQAQVLDLLGKLREDFGLSLVMVSHDLAVVGQMCDRILVMRRGKVVEDGPAHQILSRPTNEYTANLLDAARSVSLRR